MIDAAKARLRWSLLTLAGVAILGALVVAALFFGGFDAAADYAWPQPATWAIHRTMINSVRARADDVVPAAAFAPDQVQAGFRLYDAHCAMCHGGPGLARQPWTSGLEPTPPYLVDAARQWRREELFWIIRNGVRMTAMPSWRSQLTSAQTWQVVAFLEALPNVTGADYARMRAAAPPSSRDAGGGEPSGGRSVPLQGPAQRPPSSR